jgi:ribosomal protein S27AE
MRARKLTDEQLERIRTVIAARKALPTHAELARLHGVSKSLVDQIAAGVMYKVPRGTLVGKHALDIPAPQAIVRNDYAHIDMSAPCSRCGGARDRPGQKYCRICHAAYQREHRPKYSELNPEQRMKSNSRARANTAQKRGQLIKQPCEKCGDPASQKHHENYSKPLEVRWLCARCHQQEHADPTTKSHVTTLEVDPTTPQTQL